MARVKSYSDALLKNPEHQKLVSMEKKVKGMLETQKEASEQMKKQLQELTEIIEDSEKTLKEWRCIVWNSKKVHSPTDEHEYEEGTHKHMTLVLKMNALDPKNSEEKRAFCRRLTEGEKNVPLQGSDDFVKEVNDFLEYFLWEGLVFNHKKDEVEYWTVTKFV